MGRRDLFFKTMRREGGDFIPFEFVLCPALLEKFKEKTGREDYDVYYDFPQRNLYVPFKLDASRFDYLYPDKTNLWISPEFGYCHRSGSVAHFSHLEPSMEWAQSESDFDNYPYPNPYTDYDWASVAAAAKEIKANDYISVAQMEMTLFEVSWYIRGMETFLMDMLSDPDFAEYQLDKITEIRKVMAAQYAKAGADVLRLGDDVATQLAMMMSPELWRRMLKPRLKAVIDAAKAEKPDIMIFYHGDGNMFDIFGDLIEVGVEIINPIQPECIDPVKAKEKYGDRVSFWGCIGTQTTMPFGTPDEVESVCKNLIEKVGRGGGLLLAPSHMLEPEVKWENVEAFVKVVKEHNEKAMNK
jgi:uroporphyrinogen decarboxylase